MSYSLADIPDTEENLLRYAEIEFAGLPQILDDYRQDLIAHAIANWPMLKEPYVGGFFIKLSQQKDADEVIVLWESPRAEELRAALTEEQNKELAGYYGQVLSRFESVDA